MRQIAVIGAGSFGSTVALMLAAGENQVIIIDSNEKVIQDIKENVTQAVVADATDAGTLAELIGPEIEAAVVSLGDNVEASIMVAMHLKEIGVGQIIVKAISDDHAKVLNMVGATDVIFPEREMAKRVANTLTSSDVLDCLPLAPGYTIMEMAAPRDFIGKTLAEIDLRRKHGIQIVAIKSVVPENVNLVPGGDYRIKDSDALVVVGKDSDLKELRKK